MFDVGRCVQVLKSFMQSFAVASVLALGAGVGHAATVISYQKPGDAFNGNGSAGVRVTSIDDPVANVGARAGGFFLKGNVFGNGIVENFVGWCLDIKSALADGIDYVPTKTPFAQDKLTTTQVDNIGRLFNTALSGLDFKNGALSAGFQLALWEIIYEKPETAFNLGLGNLTVTGDTEAIKAGQAFLNNLGGKVTQRWDLVFLESTNNQDLVTATPVPVPAAAGLMLLALGGLAVVGRRRRTV
jgi:hypothetical protein